MKVILKQDIKGTGRKGEVKDVADGYANNFLIPKGIAEFASPEAVKRVEAQKATALVEEEIVKKLATKQIEMLKGIKIVLEKKANDKGHLFEQIHPEEILEALKKQAKLKLGVENLIVEKPIKEIGEHQISAQAGKTLATFLVIVEPSK